MENIKLLYGKSHINLHLDQKNVVLFRTKQKIPRKSALDYVKNAFLHPLFDEDSDQSADNFNNKTIAIAINDQTRPLPHSILLPSLIEFLITQKKAKKENITFYISTGTHRKLTKKEVSTVLPDNLDTEFHYFCHNCDAENDLIYIGYTSKRTPVFVNKRFYQSDIKIVVGNIEPHHFMGFSGGMKTAAIGLTGRQTIEKNHAMLTDPMAKMGLFMDNPMRRDVEEIGRMIDVHYALNVVLNDRKEIIAALWGEPYKVMQQGIPISLDSCQLDVHVSDCQFDLVIASAGGHPKDINLYQAQKAITNSCLFSKDGGVIILAAACQDGAGNDKFLEFLHGKNTPQEIIQAFTAQSFEIGPHKAYQIALQALNHKIILISELPAGEIPDFLLKPAHDMDEAIKLAFTWLPEEPRIAVLPYATHTMPRIT